MLCSFLPALQSLDVWCFQASEQERALREFKCKLCSGVLSEPVSAPCVHHFCRPCLEKHFQVHCHKASGKERMLTSLCWLTAADMIHVTWLHAVTFLQFKYSAVHIQPLVIVCIALCHKYTVLSSCYGSLTCIPVFCPAHLSTNSHKPVGVRHSELLAL